MTLQMTMIYALGSFQQGKASNQLEICELTLTLLLSVLAAVMLEKLKKHSILGKLKTLEKI